MLWVDRTYWVRSGADGLLGFAITSDMEMGELVSLLNLDPDNTSIMSAGSVEPCVGCLHQSACMESVWLEGKRMAGPLVGDASNSEVVSCHYCTVPTLTLFRWGDANNVPENCPRQTGRRGECDGCRRFRSSLMVKEDATTSDKVFAHTILGTILGEPDLQSALTRMSPDERCARMKRLVSILCWMLDVEIDPARMVRAIVLELCDGSVVETWHAKSPATRRFTIRCWEGVIRNACKAP